MNHIDGLERTNYQGDVEGLQDVHPNRGDSFELPDTRASSGPSREDSYGDGYSPSNGTPHPDGGDMGDDLDRRFLFVLNEVDAPKGDGEDGNRDESMEFKQIANTPILTDYAHELAFLPDLTELVATTLDYQGTNVISPVHTVAQQVEVIAVLKKHVRIMISS